MMCECVGGYKNRETWAMSLWLNNDQSLGESFRDWLEVRLEDRVNDEPVTDWWKYDYRATEHARDWAEIWLTPSGYVHQFGDDWPMSLAKVASDIGSLYRIDWMEVMNNVLPDE